MLNFLTVQAFPQQDFEVIIVADGCKDGTVEMLNKYKGNLNLVVCELKGVGAAAAERVDLVFRAAHADRTAGRRILAPPPVQQRAARDSRATDR